MLFSCTLLTFVYVSVSIPKQVLHDPYKVKPHRRRSFDATDSCALSDVSFYSFVAYYVTAKLP